MIDFLQEDGGGRIETNHPGEGKDVVETGQENRKFGDGNHGPHQGLKEGAPLTSALPLFDANEP